MVGVSHLDISVQLAEERIASSIGFGVCDAADALPRAGARLPGPCLRGGASRAMRRAGTPGCTARAGSSAVAKRTGRVAVQVGPPLLALCARTGRVKRRAKDRESCGEGGVLALVVAGVATEFGVQPLHECLQARQLRVDAPGGRSHERSPYPPRAHMLSRRGAAFATTWDGRGERPQQRQQLTTRAEHTC